MDATHDVARDRAGAFSALLAGAYVSLVIASEAVFVLVVAGSFLPVRTRVQRFVDRRFYRSKVDSEETMARFGARLRREADLDTLLSELSDAVRETFQPTEAWVWLHPDELRRRNDPETVAE